MIKKRKEEQVRTIFYLDSISPFFESIYSQLVKCDSNESFFDRDANLATYSFITLENLISYSSHDKQGKLSEILVTYVTKIMQLSKRTDLMNQSHLIEDLESYYCLIIRTTIKKYISTLQLNDCQNIYQVIIGTFMRRKNIYDEGLLAISSFAISK